MISLLLVRCSGITTLSVLYFNLFTVHLLSAIRLLLDSSKTILLNWNHCIFTVNRSRIWKWNSLLCGAVAIDFHAHDGQLTVQEVDGSLCHSLLWHSHDKFKFQTSMFFSWNIRYRIIVPLILPSRPLGIPRERVSFASAVTQRSEFPFYRSEFLASSAIRLHGPSTLCLYSYLQPDVALRRVYFSPIRLKKNETIFFFYSSFVISLAIGRFTCW